MGAEWERLALKWQFDHIVITLFYIRWDKIFSSHLCILNVKSEKRIGSYLQIQTEF